MGKRSFTGAPRNNVGGSGSDVAMVPVTRWAQRNMGWWRQYLERGSPRMCCLLPKVSVDGAVEADAALSGYGGFHIVGTTMYYFHGKWTDEEKASFESKEPNTLDINSFELTTQKFSLFLGRKHFANKVVMPKCDNDSSVVLHDSFKARNEFMASLLEEYDQIAAAHAIEVHMVHIPGVRNTCSDILSREGVTDLFYAAVTQDFPSITNLQDVSSRLPASVRSLSKLLGTPE